MERPEYILVQVLAFLALAAIAWFSYALLRVWG
jgi:hypothetical protein